MTTSDWHALVALGTDGGQPLADGDSLARGVHLLWSIRSELGFPADGYHVWRRRHRDPEWNCLDMGHEVLPPVGTTAWEWFGYRLEARPGPVGLDPNACGKLGALHLRGSQVLEVRAALLPAAVVRVRGTGSLPAVEALVASGGELVVAARTAATRAAEGEWVAELWADGLIGVRLTGEDLRVCWICFGAAVEGGWELLSEDALLLPVVPRGTRNDAAQIQTRTATRDEARLRLSETLATKEDLATEFAGDVGELIEDLLHGGRDAALHQTADESASRRTPPRLVMPTASLLALAAIDPDMSRMLGLYWHDPVDSGLWDYRVVAHHGSGRYPGRRVSFDNIEAGPIGAGMLTHDGIAFVGTAGLEVRAGNGDPAALRVPAPRVGTVAGMQLDPPVPALTMRVAEGTFMPFTAWQGSARVDSATGSTGEIVLAHGSGIDAVTWTSGPIDLLEVELHLETGSVGDLAAHAWNLSPRPPDPVRDLTLTAVASAAESTRLQPDGAIDRATGLVGLDWAADSVQNVHQPLRVLVARAFRGSPAAPVAGPFELRNSEHPALAFARSPALPGPRPGPDVPRGWTERALSDGWYSWRIRGVDAFGRLGAWSTEREVEVASRTSPPPPDQVLARYLHPADPHLSADDRARTDANGAGLLVEWTWPAQRRIQAPQVEPDGEFRVLLRHGDPNLLQGNVLGVGESRLDTDLDWNGAANDLVGELLRLGAASFEVTGNGIGQNIWIAVRDLTAPTLRPTVGPFTISFSETGKLRTDLGRSHAFDQRVHAKPVGPVLHTRSQIAGVRDTTVTLVDPLPPTPADPLPGWLVCGAIAYPVTSQAPGSSRLEVDGVVQADGSTALPVPGEPCSVWAGASYLAWLPGIRIEPGAQDAVALALVAVSTSDGDPSVADDPGWSRPGRGGLGGRPGREGRTSRVARVTVPRRTHPPPVHVVRPPEQDGDIPADQAEPADWFGRAHYRLVFTPVTGAAGYRVLRASTAALFTRDRVQRQSGVGPYSSGPFDDEGTSEAWLDEHYPSLSVADLTADLSTHPDPARVQAAWRDWGEWYYPSLLNRDVMALAERAGNEESFRPAHDGIVAGSPYQDTVDGRGLGRFVYRVRSVDASGNDGPWSAAFPLVDVRDVTAPATPVLLSVFGDENAVAITLRAGAEPDLVSYRVWRAERADALADVRRRQPHAEVPATAGRMTEIWRDEALPGQRDWYYRLASVDAAGNVSTPTAVVKARPVDTRAPNPPVWLVAEWIVDAAGDAVRLMWRADEGWLTCVVQRRPLGGGVWQAVSPPIGATGSRRDFEFVDRSAVPGADYEYRVSTQDVAGNPNVDFAIREVRA